MGQFGLSDKLSQKPTSTTNDNDAFPTFFFFYMCVSTGMRILIQRITIHNTESIV